MDIFNCASMVFEKLGPIANAMTLFQMIFPDTIAETYDNFNKFYFGDCYDGNNTVTDIKMTVVCKVTTANRVTAVGSINAEITKTITTTISAKVNGVYKEETLNVEKFKYYIPNCKFLKVKK
jgi:hypothetical protein